MKSLRVHEMMLLGNPTRIKLYKYSKLEILNGYNKFMYFNDNNRGILLI